jgi:hypothetical protein
VGEVGWNPTRRAGGMSIWVTGSDNPNSVGTRDSRQVSGSQLALHRVRIARQFDVPVPAHSTTGVLADDFHCTLPVDEGRVELLVGQVGGDLKAQILRRHGYCPLSRVGGT